MNRLAVRIGNQNLPEEQSVMLSLPGRQVFNPVRASSGMGMFSAVVGTTIVGCLDIENDDSVSVKGVRGSTIRTLTIIPDKRAPRQRLKVRTAQSTRSAHPYFYIEGRFWVEYEDDSIFDVFDPLEELEAGQERPVFAQKTVKVEGKDHVIPVVREPRALRF